MPVSFGVLFGSFAKGTSRSESDIDLLVVSPRFDGKKNREDVSLLWRNTLFADSRIVPLPVGLIEWQTDTGRPILEIARREGVVVPVL